VNRQSDPSDSTPELQQNFAWGDWIPALFVIPIGLVMAVALWKFSVDRDRTLACVGQGLASQTWVTGQLRQAGPDFFLQADRWRLLVRGCHGKTRMQCLQNNPGISALERNLGQTILVQFCGMDAVVYEVEGQTFRVYPKVS